MWAIGNFPRLDNFFRAARKLGFSKFELNHQVNSAMLAGIDLKAYRFSSVHEPCPADISTERLKAQDWLISALDEDSRRQGVAAVKRSIDLAKTLDVPVIVVHCGLVHPNHPLESDLRRLFKAGLDYSQEYLDVNKHLIDLRAELAGPHLQAAKKSLVELIEYASLSGIRLGLENRYHYLDIPTLEEMEMLLSLAGADQLGFIYDVGHAQALDRLGFFPYEAWLKRYATRIIGVHLHDVIGIDDHYAPGLGSVDFERVASYLPDSAFRTCELRPASTLEQIDACLKYLTEKGCITC
jgi:sugar phosphate isomerase/epimerase